MAMSTPDFADTVPNMPEHELNQTDALITNRDRYSRGLVAFASPVLSVLLGYLIGATLAGFFRLPMVLGNVVGLALGAAVAVWLVSRSYIVNDAVSAFVTVDLWNKELVTYGPGFHFCFPWEARSGANNVDLSEAAEDGTFEVQATNGTLHGKFSVRLRPDIKNLPKFLAGVGSVAADLRDIIKASILEKLAGKKVIEALSESKGLNKELKDEFAQGPNRDTKVTKFEDRFGVIVGDVTVSELLPSKEVQKAMDGESEGNALDGLIAKNLGRPDMSTVHADVASGAITTEQYQYATENALAMTENLGGMAIERKTYTVRLQGDPGLVEAAKAIVPHAPAIAGALGAGNQPRGNKPRSNQRRK